MKLIAEFRRRALSVMTLADGIGSIEEARELKKIARAYERLARLREMRLSVAHDPESTEQS